MSFEEVTERRLNDHAERIRALEIKDATKDQKLENLFTTLEKLSNDIRELMAFMKSIMWKIIGGMGAGILLLLSFFFWYVQSLAK